MHERQLFEIPINDSNNNLCNYDHNLNIDNNQISFNFPNNQNSNNNNNELFKTSNLMKEEQPVIASSKNKSCIKKIKGAKPKIKVSEKTKKQSLNEIYNNTESNEQIKYFGYSNKYRKRSKKRRGNVIHENTSGVVLYSSNKRVKKNKKFYFCEKRLSDK